MQDGRYCFHQVYGDEEFVFEIPNLDDDGKALEGKRRETCDTDRVFEILTEFGEKTIPGVKPGCNPFILLWKVFPKQLCPVGLLDPKVSELMEMAYLCKEYGTLPYAGGLWDQPRRIIEGLKIVAEAKAQFHNDTIASMKSKGGKK